MAEAFQLVLDFWDEETIEADQNPDA